MKVVIDSNIFIVCLNPFSTFNSVFTKLVKGSYELCISTDISFQYLEVFHKKFQKTKADAITKFLSESNNVIFNEVYYYCNLISYDPDDNKFIDCAIACNADYIVSNDRRFNILKEIGFPKIECISIEEFLEILKTFE